MKKIIITDLDDTLYDWLGFFIPSFYEMVDEIVNITKINKDILLKEYKSIHQCYGSVEYPFATLELPSILNKYKVDVLKKLKEPVDKYVFYVINNSWYAESESEKVFLDRKSVV